MTKIDVVKEEIINIIREDATDENFRLIAHELLGDDILMELIENNINSIESLKDLKDYQKYLKNLITLKRSSEY